MDTPYPFKYLIRKNSKIQFDLRNRDTSVDPDISPVTLYHFVSINFNGIKYV
jgi:hypothetical protein